MNATLIFDSILPRSFNKQLVICGSMSYYQYMAEAAMVLRQEGVRAELPIPENSFHLELSELEYSSFKRRASYEHLKRIRSPKTAAILALNLDRHGIKNYIGTSTFSEIAVAFAHSKRIFTYQPFPDAYKEELILWGAQPVEGNFSPIVELFKRFSEQAHVQPSLFPG